MRILRLLIVTLVGCVVPLSPSSAGIILDYSHDSFFSTNATAKAALEAAVADINGVLDLNLGAVTNDVTTGTSGGGSTQLDFDFRYSYTNPSTGGAETIADTTLSANEIQVFVGMRNLTGATLGQGGPGGGGVGITGMVGAGDVQLAINDAMAMDQHRRGDGPTIGNLSGTVAGGNYSFDLGPTIGNLWFDSDTDNNGSTDNAATLAANWHFDHTTAVAAGKDDFYTVALHETLHAIGYGTSDSWDALVTGGTEWTGAEAIALNGTGVGLIDSGGGHVAAGTMSTRLSDGMAQEVVMDPDLTTGTRKYLTALDAAFIRDIGFSTAAVPEPSGLILFGLVMFGAFQSPPIEIFKSSHFTTL